MTKQELELEFDRFLAVWNNKYLDYDGVYGAQCFDLIQKWNRDYLKAPFIGGDYAYQIYGQLLNWYTSIPNTPDAIPQKGDIVVWSKGYNNFAGHTGVATGKGDLNTFECFEQNDPIGSVSHLKTYNYNYVIGWLRLKTIIPVIDYKKICIDVKNQINSGEPDNKKVQYIKDILMKAGI